MLAPPEGAQEGKMLAGGVAWRAASCQNGSHPLVLSPSQGLSTNQWQEAGLLGNVHEIGSSCCDQLVKIPLSGHELSKSLHIGSDFTKRLLQKWKQ